MKRKRLLWQIYIPVVLVVVISIFASTWYAADTLRGFFLKQTESDLVIRAGLISKQLTESFIKQDYGRLNELCKLIGPESGTRITVILRSGEVLADSSMESAKMDNHADRLEVAQALSIGIGSAIRNSKTVQKKMLYLAVPLGFPKPKTKTPATAIGVLRLSIPITSIDQALSKVVAKIIFGAFVLVLIAAAITLKISRQITRPLEEMRVYAERLSHEDFEKKATLVPAKDSSVEIAGLANALNMMAGQLDERLQLLTKQKNELEAVFASMVESVIVVSSAEQVIRMNKAATRLLGFSPKEVPGMATLDSFVNAEMVKFIRHVLAERRQMEEEIVLNDDPGKIYPKVYLKAHGTLLLDAQGKGVGALIVLHDVTRLKRLENMRRDFVANVSHELKTPITTIKGFVETLQDGAMASPKDAKRFFGIILKHADRLNAIVDDLLTLARTEQESDKQEIILTPELVRKTLCNAVETCTPKAQEKGIYLSLKCSVGLTVKMDEPLLEQAITNLIVNAIKYSPKESEVHINAFREGDEVVISVKDYGVGIAKVHQPRIFERFYRTDKARSRKLGGTGLGLSIVKHIAKMHGGTVTVDSTPGRGSIFSIKIP